MEIKHPEVYIYEILLYFCHSNNQLINQYVSSMLLKIYPDKPNSKEIDKVINILRDGGLVIYPTDTLYAIGCDALNVRAVEKICRIKGTDSWQNRPNGINIFEDFFAKHFGKKNAQAKRIL